MYTNKYFPFTLKSITEDRLLFNLLFLYRYLFILFFFSSQMKQMKSTTVLYRYNDISRKNGFYSLNIRHAAITGAIYTLVSIRIRRTMGFYFSQDLYRKTLPIYGFMAKVWSAHLFNTGEKILRCILAHILRLLFIQSVAHFYKHIKYQLHDRIVEGHNKSDCTSCLSHGYRIK